MTPASFRARSTLNRCFTFAKTYSMGLYSGEYGTLNMNRKPNREASAFDFSLLWAERLSRKIAIFSSGYIFRNSYRYVLNLATLTDYSYIWNSSWPFSFEIADRTASVGSFRCARSAGMF